MTKCIIFLMKKKKIKKNILFLFGLGIVTTAIVVPVLLLNKKDKENKENNENKKEFNLLKNSNIDKGQKGVIFQDEFKNLWTMGYNQKLQVLKVNNDNDGYDEITGWTNNNKVDGLLKNSNINDGFAGTIFQDDFKNLWTMGYGSKLQVLRANQNKDGYVSTWTSDNTSGLLNGSNINKGQDGTIFQDSFKNLWAMGENQKLQVLRANQNKDGYVSAWTSATNSGLTNGSVINKGQDGTIFQDQFKNLWAMSFSSTLQVLKVNENGDGYVSAWTNNNKVDGLLKNSNVDDGDGGTIFQDKFKNLWIMSLDQKLQVLKVNDDNDDYDEITGWNNNNKVDGLLKNSDIENGYDGTFFQDEFKNLWIMGNDATLQVLKANENGDGYDEITGWNNNNKKELLNGSMISYNQNIDNNWNGTIFQDQFKNLWATGSDAKLQVLKANQNQNGYVSAWTDDNSENGEKLLRNSKINDGEYGTIFQDDFKNLWVMGSNSKLQVLEINITNDVYVKSWQ